MKFIIVYILMLISTITTAQELDMWGVPKGKYKKTTTIKNEKAANVSDANGLKQGLWTKYSNGTLIYKGSFVNNKPVGEFIRYHENGKIKSKQLFNDKSTIAYTQLFDHNQKLVAKGKYLNNKKDSTWIWFGKNGQILVAQTYIKGVQEGQQVRYFPTGKVYEKVAFINGEKQGDISRYYPDGALRLTATYANNQLHGSYTTFYPEGGKEMEGNYKNGVKDGVWKTYTPHGVTEMQRTYTNGVLKDKTNIDKAQQRMFEEHETKAGSFRDPEDFISNPTEY